MNDTLTVHSVEPAKPPPVPKDGSGYDYTSLIAPKGYDWYHIDVTVSPPAEIDRWVPGLIHMVSAWEDPMGCSPQNDVKGSVADLWDGTRFTPYLMRLQGDCGSYDSVSGPTRLRVLAGLGPQHGDTMWLRCSYDLLGAVTFRGRKPSRPAASRASQLLREWLPDAVVPSGYRVTGEKTVCIFPDPPWGDRKPGLDMRCPLVINVWNNHMPVALSRLAQRRVDTTVSTWSGTLFHSEIGAVSPQEEVVFVSFRSFDDPRKLPVVQQFLSRLGPQPGRP